MLALWVLGVALTAAVAAYVLVGAAARHGRKLGMIDRPRPGEVQAYAVPRSGGYAMLAALWLAVGVAVFGRPGDVMATPGDDWKLLGVLLGSLAILPLALLDDRHRLGPLPQLIGQIVIAAIPVAFGLRIGSVASPFGEACTMGGWTARPS